MLGEGMCLRAGATIGEDTEERGPCRHPGWRRRLWGPLAFRNVDMSMHWQNHYNIVIGLQLKLIKFKK